ncbi:Pyridoxamine 5'-phosphate oxidase [Chitinophaga jiangningensis]|uniref:Pyridoxine/pyridoxamine 5'-phosphate oxidase n=1 Tax=Chitinophaga jiangningensis TaxID=1419482 RepID=A0A1M7HZ50_9BACT|nr:pyridoxamine 5'-phosphate oxidase [Chitinophaga jiangningensis]SHM33669.1 Pyridoxamine 5'-phosphate oxidase [Chitinophaga jiangningensis]
MLNQKIADLRKDYIMASLDEHDVAKEPLQQFSRWWNDATTGEVEEANAMTLATSTPDGHPSARIVLLKSFDDEGFLFFTNYDSQKGEEMAANPHVSLLFFWRELERQVRIVGTVSKAPAAVSDAYYNSRPEGSRIGAIASPQSRVISDRSVLEEEVARLTGKYAGNTPVRPDYWGGYIVKPASLEFWQGRSSRLHDRIRYTLQGDGNWKIERLAP